jgi:hypothetical protein
MVLGFTQALTEISTRRYFWGKARSACKADNLTAIYEPMSRKCGIFNISHPYRPVQPVTGTALLFYYNSVHIGIVIGGIITISY